MNHRERVLAAVRHEIPDRIPMGWLALENPTPLLEHLGLNPALGNDGLGDYFGADVRMLSAGQTDDMFGNAGHGKPYGLDLERKPFYNVETVREIEAHPWPSVDSLGFDPLMSYSKNHTFENSAGHAICIGNWTPVFCEVCDFFTMERALLLLHENPVLIEATVARIEAFYLEYCERMFKAAAGRADFFHMWDDFASQRGLIMSPETWRKFFKPTLQKMFALAKANGLRVWFHSCGNINDVMPDLIDMGMDVWETVQAHLDGNAPVQLKRNYGRHITFNGGVNTQSVLPFGTPEQVRQEVRERMRVLGEDGGYICSPDHMIKRETPLENILALYDEINTFRAGGCTL
jgi:uroporphyrinogen decarboxylase